MPKITRQVQYFDAGIGFTPIYEEVYGSIGTSVIYGNHFARVWASIHEFSEPGAK